MKIFVMKVVEVALLVVLVLFRIKWSLTRMLFRRRYIACDRRYRKKRQYIPTHNVILPSSSRNMIQGENLRLALAAS